MNPNVGLTLLVLENFFRIKLNRTANNSAPAGINVDFSLDFGVGCQTVSKHSAVPADCRCI